MADLSSKLTTARLIAIIAALSMHALTLPMIANGQPRRDAREGAVALWICQANGRDAKHWLPVSGGMPIPLAQATAVGLD
jgi:hypothetical protein